LRIERGFNCEKNVLWTKSCNYLTQRFSTPHARATRANMLSTPNIASPTPCGARTSRNIFFQGRLRCKPPSNFSGEIELYFFWWSCMNATTSHLKAWGAVEGPNLMPTERNHGVQIITCVRRFTLFLKYRCWINII